VELPQATSLFRVGQALPGLKEHAAKLAEISIPRWFGAKDIRASAEDSMRQALMDASAAAGMLADGGASPTSIEAANNAVDLLWVDASTKLRTSHVAKAAESLRSAIDVIAENDATAIEAANVEYAKSLVTQEPQSIPLAQLKDLARLLQLPEVKEAMPPLNDLASFELKSLDDRYMLPRTVRILGQAQRYLEFSHIPVAERGDIARQIITKDFDSISEHELRTLQAFVEADPQGTSVPIPEQLDAYGTFARAVDMHLDGQTSALQRYMSAAKLAYRSDAERSEIAQTILAKSFDEVTSEDWRTLQAFDDYDFELLNIPTWIENSTNTFERTLIRHFNGEETPELRRFFEATKSARKTEDELRAAAKPILGKEYEDITNDEWSTLLAIADHDTENKVLHQGKHPLYSFAHEIAERLNGNDHFGLAHSFDTARVAAMDDTARAQLAHRFLTTPHRELGPSDWSLFRCLVEHDEEGHFVPIPQGIRKRPGFVMVRSINSRTGMPMDGDYNEYLSAAKLLKRSPSERRQIAMDVLTKDYQDVTEEDLASLMAVIDADPSVLTTTGSRAYEPGSLAAAIGKPTVNNPIVRQFVRAQLSLLSDNAFAALTDSIRHTKTSEMTPQNWYQLAEILSNDELGQTLPRIGHMDRDDWIGRTGSPTPML
jgi:hypothetical protein